MRQTARLHPVIGSFLAKEKQETKKYRYLFFLIQIAVLGMLFSFPFQGYAAVSITFSTL